MSWAAVIVGGVSLGLGIYQTVKSNNAKKDLDRPDYTRPSEIKGNPGIAEQVMYEGMPESAKQAYTRQIQRQQAAMLQSQGSLNAGLSGLAAANVSAADATSRMHIEDAKMKLQGKKLMMDSNREQAGYTDREFSYDYQNYLEDRDYAYAMQAAGMQNMAKGLDYGASAVAGIGGGEENRTIHDIDPMETLNAPDLNNNIRDQYGDRQPQQSSAYSFDVYGNIQTD